MKRQLKPCGTPAAARRHLRKREIADPACLAAQAKYVREWRAERKRKAAIAEEAGDE